MEKPPFSEREDALMKKVTSLYREFMDLAAIEGFEHPADKAKVIDSVHNLQELIMLRLCRKQYPETFNYYRRSHNGTTEI